MKLSFGGIIPYPRHFFFFFGGGVVREVLDYHPTKGLWAAKISVPDNRTAPGLLICPMEEHESGFNAGIKTVTYSRF